MINIRSCLLVLQRKAVYAQEWYGTVHSAVKNWQMWAVRRALLPYITIHCWVFLRDGSKFFLGADRIDDIVLEGVLGRHLKLYFPEEIFDSSKNWLILDVGAHHGFYAVGALRRYPKASLIALEPNPKAIDLLKKNLVANDLSRRVEIVQAAIGSQDGFAFLEYSGGGSWGDRTVLAKSSGGSGVEVRTVKVSTILQGRKPNLVKCNAEGAEFELFPQLFSMGIRPEIVILMAHPEYGSVGELLERFRIAGYRIQHAGSTQKRLRLHCMLNQETT